ncbi:hypothetical protein [Brunnivagina elsteri]|uniref:Uncharacterized protein n=1 Tax=Brunnivagina elsteri CCALA 953 TaxID=987040 RepID=A0A2A2TMK7_9CYAN|nr:hypothetical protein [Calothrix elsteri]PAX59786.1 hypothetical protein CK510_05250 [Calothrix elsteri CCALA 953]
MNLLNLFKPKPKAPTIDSYGQPNSIEPQEIQSIMEWLFASLMSAGYFGRSHIIWYDSDNPDPSLEQVVKKVMHREEPVFLYRIGGRVQTPRDGYYWRMMNEHPSMRVYQFEVRD